MNFPKKLDSLLASIDASLSTYDTTSLISSFNRGDTILADRLFQEMLSFSQAINIETNGAFDPTIGPLIKAWGWDFSKAEEMDSLKVDSLLQIKGFDKISITNETAYLKDPRAKLNFNAIAQGYSVDLMADLIESKGINNYYIELGGELKVKGLKLDSSLWRIGIDRPEENNTERDLVAVINLENKALATSGNYRKFYEKDGMKYSHTIDPSSGYPVSHSLLSATVISNDCYRADALATAFMVMGYERSVEFLRSSKTDLGFLIFAKEDGEYGYFISSELETALEKID